MIATLKECRRHLARHKRTHPAAPLITNLVEASKSFQRETDPVRRKAIAGHMEETILTIERASP